MPRTLASCLRSPSKPPTVLVRRARKMHRVLADTYPDAGCELDFADPYQLLVATVLSAQTTDRRVNAVTPALFAQYPDATALASADRRARRGPRAHHRILPRQDEQPAAHVRRDRRELRRRGPAPARRPRHAARSRAQDRQRRARQRVRRARAHRRHPFRAARSPVRVDRRRRRPRTPSAPSTPSVRCSPRATGRCSATASSGTAAAAATPASPRAAPAPWRSWCPAYGTGPTDPEVAAKLVTTQGRA